MALGFVLTPYGKIPGGYFPAGQTIAYDGATEFLDDEPQFWTSGEAGYYYDTPLGAPRDATVPDWVNRQNYVPQSINTPPPIPRTTRTAPEWVDRQAQIKPGFLERRRIRRTLRELGRAGGLGAIPTDFELATVRGYLPVESGWVPTAQGYVTGGWSPPHGVNPAGPVPIAPRGDGRVTSGVAGLRGAFLGQGAEAVATDENGNASGPLMPGATTEEVMTALQAHNDRLFALAIVSTAAVAVSALIGLFRTLKLIREGQ